MLSLAGSVLLSVGDSGSCFGTLVTGDFSGGVGGLLPMLCFDRLLSGDLSGEVALTVPSSFEFGLDFCRENCLHTGSSNSRSFSADSGVENILTGDFGGKIGSFVGIPAFSTHFRGETGGPFFCNRDCSSCSLVTVPTWMMDVKPFGVVEFCIVAMASVSEMAEIIGAHTHSAPKLDCIPL